MAIIAFLSDIPLFIAQFISDLTGADMSGFVNGFNDIFAGILGFIEGLLA